MEDNLGTMSQMDLTNDGFSHLGPDSYASALMLTTYSESHQLNSVGLYFKAP